MNGKFTHIVNGGGGNFDSFFDDWNETDAADDFGSVLPAGRYVCLLRKGELATSRKGTASYKLTFEVETGEHAGRKLWHDIWLTAASKTIAKRDLQKLGITNPKDQLKQPVPQWLRCAVTLGIHKADDGTERNNVIRFEVLEKSQPEADPFAPQANSSGKATAADKPASDTFAPGNAADGTDSEGVPF